MKGEREKRTPLITGITREQIIRDKGYYDINRNWNAIITFPDKPGKIFRDRVEVLILNNRNQIYMVNYGNGVYRIPGGGVEKDHGYKYQVEKESEEEAGISLGKIFTTNVSYFRFFDVKYESCPIHWDGTYSRVYVAYFKDWYFGKVDESVRDTDMRYKGRFIPYEKAINILNETHLAALREYNNIKNKKG